MLNIVIKSEVNSHIVNAAVKEAHTCNPSTQRGRKMEFQFILPVSSRPTWTFVTK